MKPSTNDVLIFLRTYARDRAAIETIYKTWGADEHTVSFDGIDSSYHAGVIRLDGVKCSEYNRTTDWVNIMNSAYHAGADWYLKVDENTFLNPLNLRNFLSALTLAGVKPSTNFVYTGLFGVGGPHATQTIALLAKQYSLGRSDILLSRKALELARIHLPTCMHTNFGRTVDIDAQLLFCVYTGPDERMFERMAREVRASGFTNQHERVPEQGVYSSNEADAWLKLKRLTSEEINAITLHVKDPKESEFLYKALLQNYSLRADLNPVYMQKKLCHKGCVCSPPSHTTEALLGVCQISHLRSKLVSEIAVNDEITASALPIASKIHAYVLTLKQSTGVHSLVRFLSQIFGTVTVTRGITANSVKYSSSKLSPGEMAYRESMQQIMTDAISRGHQTVAIFDDDVMFHSDYKRLLGSLLNCTRCACILSNTGCTPGVLKLGNTAWGNQHNVEWAVYEHGIVRDPCTTFNDKDLGSYATLYNTHTFKDILLWLAIEQNLPFDWVYAWLAERNVPVRGAYPFLNIADISHPSAVRNRTKTDNIEALVKKRALLHGWNLSLYSLPH